MNPSKMIAEYVEKIIMCMKEGRFSLGELHAMKKIFEQCVTMVNNVIVGATAKHERDGEEGA